MFGLSLNKINIGNFYPLEVVGRGSETQLQVCEKIKLCDIAGKGLKCV